MSWLGGILKRGRFLKRKRQAEALGFFAHRDISEEDFNRQLKRFIGSTLPENPTVDDVRRELDRIVQIAKVAQNEGHHWPDDKFKRIVILAESEMAKVRGNDDGT